MGIVSRESLLSHNRSKNKSRAWSNQHNQDRFVLAARTQGFRARSAFKLSEVDRKHHLLRPSDQIVDLGAAPGGWSIYAASRMSDAGRVVGVDLLEIKPIKGVIAIQGNFTEHVVQEAILECFKGKPLDLVLSDMSPNITGVATIDQANAENMQIAILEFCRKSLKSGGTVLTKLFAGSSTEDIRKMFSREFGQIKMIKPDASRAASKEVYLLAKDYRIQSSMKN